MESHYHFALDAGVRQQFGIVGVFGLGFNRLGLHRIRLDGLGLFGLVLGFVRRASGSLVPSILVHATFNAVTFFEMAARPPEFGEQTEEVLAEFGFTRDEIGSLRQKKIV